MPLQLASSCQVSRIYLLTACWIDKPQEDPNIRGDAFKTLIVARLSYNATEQDLEQEFSRFGAIERVCFVSPLHVL